MAPATHSCGDRPFSDPIVAQDSTNSGATEGDCSNGEHPQNEDNTVYYGRNMLSTSRDGVQAGTANVKVIEPPNPPTAERPMNLAKEPAFIAAVVLTVLILIGGFVVMKLSNTPLPKRTTAAPKELGISSATPRPLMPSTRVSGHGVVQGAQSTQDLGSEVVPHSHVTLRSHYPASPLPPSPLREGWSRPRQGSDASQSTEGSAPEEPSSDSIFSSTSLASSLTSHHQHPQGQNPHDELDGGGGEYYDSSDDVDIDLTEFEVKRGQTQSLELVKGVLVNWPAASVLSSSESNHDQDVVEVERADEEVEAEREGVQKGRRRSLAHAALMQRQQSANSALKVSSSLSTGTASMTSGSKIQVPELIVTEPSASTLSLFTMGSSTSNFSVELGQFPLPPLHLEPTIFWQKLKDEINTSLALKRRSNTVA